ARITRLNAGIPDNFVPDRATAHVNLRYAPDRDPGGAEAYLRSLVPDGASVELAGNSPAAAPASDAPLVDRLRETGDLELEPKQAWTNVADFAARGIPAVNFGPGAPRYAHARDEQVEIAALVRAFEVLRRFLAASWVASPRGVPPGFSRAGAVPVRPARPGGRRTRSSGPGRNRLRHGRPAGADRSKHHCRTARGGSRAHG